MKSPFLLPIGLLCVSASTGLSAVLYSSDSDWDVTAQSNLSINSKWYAAAGRSDFYSIANYDGTPANNASNRRAGIVNGPDAGTNTLDDYMYFQNSATTATTIDYFAHTSTGSNFVSFIPQNYSVLTANWQVVHDGFATGGGYFVTVQVDNGTWYASKTNAALQGATGSISINLLSSEWVAISENPTPGTSGSLTLGTTTFTYSNLFSSGQSVTGVGFFADALSATTTGNGLRSLRIDNFTIQDVIPEPSAALSGILGAGLLVLRRR